MQESQKTNVIAPEITALSFDSMLASGHSNGTVRIVDVGMPYIRLADLMADCNVEFTPGPYVSLNPFDDAFTRRGVPPDEA